MFNIPLLMEWLGRYVSMSFGVFMPIASISLGFSMGFALVDKVRGLLDGVS